MKELKGFEGWYAEELTCGKTGIKSVYTNGNDKYAILQESHIHNGEEYYQLISLSDIQSITPYTLGGFVQSKDALDYNDRSWVEANVYLKGSTVTGTSLVFCSPEDGSIIIEDSHIADSVVILGSGVIKGSLIEESTIQAFDGHVGIIDSNIREVDVGISDFISNRSLMQNIILSADSISIDKSTLKNMDIMQSTTIENTNLSNISIVGHFKSLTEYVKLSCDVEEFKDVSDCVLHDSMKLSNLKEKSVKDRNTKRRTRTSKRYASTSSELLKGEESNEI